MKINNIKTKIRLLELLEKESKVLTNYKESFCITYTYYVIEFAKNRFYILEDFIIETRFITEDNHIEICRKKVI